jgi:hypothetical protein
VVVIECDEHGHRHPFGERSLECSMSLPSTG